MAHQQRGRGRGRSIREVSVTGPNEGPTGEVAAKKDSSLANVLDVLNNRGAGASRPARSEAWDAKEKAAASFGRGTRASRSSTGGPADRRHSTSKPRRGSTQGGGGNAPIIPAKVTDADITGQHELDRAWTWWFDDRPKRKVPANWSYEDAIKPLGFPRTLEAFWRYANALIPPSELDATSRPNYHFFQHGIKPMWEDEANKDGGKWVINCSKDRSLSDKWWNLILLGLVGELLDASHEITGAVFSRRPRGDRIEVWLRGKDSNMALGVGKRILQLLNHAGPNNGSRSQMGSFEFSLHSDAQALGQSWKGKAHLGMKHVEDIMNDSKFPSIPTETPQDS
eukprot:m.104696 g.104696  ORF g.104696 m.104696 type:complete len:339 (+) comp13853_c0_seq1:321-1337(+)